MSNPAIELLDNTILHEIEPIASTLVGGSAHERGREASANNGELPENNEDEHIEEEQQEQEQRQKQPFYRRPSPWWLVSLILSSLL